MDHDSSAESSANTDKESTANTDNESTENEANIRDALVAIRRLNWNVCIPKCRSNSDDYVYGLVVGTSGFVDEIMKGFDAGHNENNE